MSDRFKWDAKSAANKFFSGATVSVGIPAVVTVSKELPKMHDPVNDAYRKCSNCGRHYNFHKDGKCN